MIVSALQVNIKRTSCLGLALILLYLLIYVAPLGNRPLVIPDETRYAEIPREMLSTGDWLTPRLNGLRYFEKPPLGYWINAVSISALGENPFAVRFSSAVAAGLTGLLVYLMAFKMLANRRTALLAAFIYLTFVEVYIIGTFSVLDNLLTLFLSAGIVFFYLALIDQQKKIEWRYMSASGIAMGLAFLTKGFLALAVPVIVLLPWLLWQGKWKTLFWSGGYVLMVATIIVVPWGISIHLQENDFWHYFFWVEHIQRFSAENAQHKAPIYYFLVALPAVAFPWFFMLPAALQGLAIFKSRNDNARLKLLWLWCLLPFIFFSLSSGKLVTYILPCFPPLAILLAVGLNQFLRQAKTQLFDYGLVFNIATLAIFLLAIVFSQIADIGFTAYTESEMFDLLLISVVLIAGMLGGQLALGKRPPQFRIMMFSLFVLPFVVFIHIAIPNQILKSKTPGKLLGQFRETINEDTLLVSDGAMIRAVNWFLRRDDVYLLSRGEVAYGLKYPDAKGRLIDPNGFASLIATRQAHQQIAVFCRKGCPQAFQSQLPENRQKLTYGKFTIWHIPAG